ncbi:putative monooxygenase p33MONOX isoform X1 [Puntigrus tetrazona]|uniref:putative monooxygenase p33MONOX isoform X1 n=1 Tax=Puntigrus tetrazona TaxID=1606681 RepID=UPI001C8A9A4F|nr:putative monooxygenase p33MONOX isoform X1 [Puntigrus tetrazona]XP_043077757.1 putative monooxygenase p33MONOX isoform X1 [Puntigrus tetrazona]
MSGPGDLPALEAGPGASEGLLGGMSIPVGMTRRALSYDDNLERPMSPPPTDININNLWRRPVIPERKFARLAEEDESEGGVKQSATFESTKPQVPVVKAKASSVMNSLIIKQTQESMHKFEKQAGLTDTGYTPHKGLTAEETRYHRLAESMHKLQMQNVDAKEEKQPSSGQSTPAGTPQSSPKQRRRGWFSSQGSTASLTGSEMSTSSSSSIDLASSDGPVERWGAFGPRPQVSKSTTDPGTDAAITGGFALQSYKGAQKPTPMEVMKAQATRLVEDPTNFKAPPKMEIPTMEGKRQMTRPHKLKHRDMNVLTPSGF